MTRTAAVAVITGAASPIGQAIARRFAAKGARLVLGDLAGDALAAFAGELGGEVVQVTGDLSLQSVAAELVSSVSTIMR